MVKCGCQKIYTIEIDEDTLEKVREVLMETYECEKSSWVASYTAAVKEFIDGTAPFAK